MVLRTSLADALQNVFSDSLYAMCLPFNISLDSAESDVFDLVIQCLTTRNTFVQHNAFVLYSL